FAGGVDALDPDAIKKVISDTLARYGRIDVLVNTVGGYKAGNPTHETDLDKTWDFMLNLNAKSALIISQAVLPTMLEQQSGAIIHTGATAGLQGSANHAAYSASKAAVFRLIESMAAEYKDDNLTINAVLPKTLDTPQNREAMPNADSSKWVTPEQVAAVMKFLASDVGHVINGGLIPVTGRG
ncbi:MAG: SDR family NAD(P)-dependent oxidoreductase, partial [Aggregatilineales bacterium]